MHLRYIDFTYDVPKGHRKRYVVCVCIESRTSSHAERARPDTDPDLAKSLSHLRRSDTSRDQAGAVGGVSQAVIALLHSSVRRCVGVPNRHIIDLFPFGYILNATSWRSIHLT